MELSKIIDLIAVFLLGFLIASLIGLYFISRIEIPFTTFLDNLNLSGNITKAPSDYIQEDQIEIYKDKIVINIKEASISKYAPTGSMIPTLDENTNGIKIVPKSEDDIKIGDIITFRENNIFIIHRVIDKGVDEEGIFFITKGDNNLINDGKVRFEDIEHKTIGVIW